MARIRVRGLRREKGEGDGIVIWELDGNVRGTDRSFGAGQNQRPMKLQYKGCGLGKDPVVQTVQSIFKAVSSLTKARTRVDPPGLEFNSLTRALSVCPTVCSSAFAYFTM
jgi:hypothetical protein